MAARKTTRKKAAPRGKRTSSVKKWALGMLFTFLVAVSASGLRYYYGPLPESIVPQSVAIFRAQPAAAPEQEEFVATVLRAVDGDTLIVLLNGKTERVRLLNVDTPESVHPEMEKNTALGREAAEFTRLQLSNRQVRLACPPNEERDKFGRLLAYVISENENFNIRLVREGYSPYYTRYGKSRYFDEDFRLAEDEARGAHRGIWKSERPDSVALNAKNVRVK